MPRSQIAELDVAMDQLVSGNFVLGEYHFILALYAETPEKPGHQVAAARVTLLSLAQTSRSLIVTVR